MANKIVNTSMQSFAEKAAIRGRATLKKHVVSAWPQAGRVMIVQQEK